MEGFSSNDPIKKEKMKLFHKVFLSYISQSSAIQSASGVAQICITWFVYVATKSAIDVGIVAIIESLSILITSLPAGIAVDRINRGLSLLISTVTGVTVFALMAWYTEFYGFDLFIIISLMIVWSASSELYRSSSSSIIPDLVEKSNLQKANGYNDSISRSIRAVSNALAGGLIISFGVVTGFVYSTMAYVAAAILIVTLIYPYSRKFDESKLIKAVQRKSAIKELKEGFNWLRGEKGLMQLTFSATVTNIFYTLPLAFLVIYVVTGIHASSLIYGIVLAIFALGFIIGSITSGHLGIMKHAGKIWVLGPICLVGPSFFILGIFPSPAISILFLLIIGIAIGFSGNTWITAAQNIVPENMRGRYFAIDGVLSFLGGAPAITLGAILISYFGIASTYIISGISLMIAGLFFLPMKSLWNLDGSYRTPDSVKQL